MAKSLKLLAVADKVVDYLYCSDVKEKYSGVELIIGCGDLPNFYLEFLHSALDAPLFFVHGNHDKAPCYSVNGWVRYDPDGGINLHRRTATNQGLIIGGLEGSMRYKPGAPYQYTDADMRHQIALMIPGLVWNRLFYGRALDILITHSPPFGVHDLDDLPHTGFKSFLYFLRHFKPRYLLHGHVHQYRQDKRPITQFGDTTIINVYPHRFIDIKVP